MREPVLSYANSKGADHPAHPGHAPSHVMRKPVLPYANKKGADHPAHPGHQ